MTRRTFQNNAKLAKIREALDTATHRSDASDAFARRQLIARLRLSRPPARRTQTFRVAAVAGALALLTTVAVLIFLNWQRAKTTSPTNDPNVGMKDITVHLDGLVNVLPLHRLIAIPKQTGAKFVMADRSTLWVDQFTRLQFESTEGDLQMNQGRLLAMFNKRLSPTRIHTPNGTIRIVGTVFSVSVTTDATTVRLFEGKIDIETTGGIVKVEPYTYVQLKNGSVQNRRTLDKSDVLSALLIPEKTFHLTGPKVPELQLPNDATPIAEPTKTILKKKPKKNRRDQDSPAPSADSGVNGLSTQGHVSPPADEMEIEHRAESDALPARESLPPAEQLLEDACSNLKKGDHNSGKEKIRDYLRQHPDDRYWEHVHSIFE